MKRQYFHARSVILSSVKNQIMKGKRFVLYRSSLSPTRDLTYGSGKASRYKWVLAQAMYTYYAKWILKYRKWKTRVANPVEKSCTQGSFVIERESKGESSIVRGVTTAQDARYIYVSDSLA
jgi:hypothetical protein